MKYQLVVAIALLALLLTPLASCGVFEKNAPPVITGACHVPEKLDYVAQGPAPLQSVDTPLAKHLQDDAKERNAHRILANDFNALRDHLNGC